MVEIGVVFMLRETEQKSCRCKGDRQIPMRALPYILQNTTLVLLNVPVVLLRYG
jgi:hypothetical protein